MPIKTRITGTVSYLKNYTPYSLNGEQLEENIDRMFSFNMLPLSTTNVNYYFGATESKIYELHLKNLTENALLTVEAVFNNSMIHLSESAILLQPSQTKIIMVTIPASISAYTIGANTSLQFKISYEPMGDLIYKNPSMVEYNQTSVPLQVRIF